LQQFSTWVKSLDSGTPPPTVAAINATVTPTSGLISTFYQLMAQLKDASGNNLALANISVGYYIDGVLYTNVLTSSNGVAFAGYHPSSYGTKSFTVKYGSITSNAATFTVNPPG